MKTSVEDDDDDDRNRIDVADNDADDYEYDSSLVAKLYNMVGSVV